MLIADLMQFTAAVRVARTSESTADHEHRN